MVKTALCGWTCKESQFPAVINLVEDRNMTEQELIRECRERGGTVGPSLAETMEPIITPETIAVLGERVGKVCLHEPVTLELPYPPTVNTYWRHVGSKVHVSRAGLVFRKAVKARLEVLALKGLKPFSGPLTLVIDAYPPDNRKRDIDNLLKATLDSLQHGGLYADDNQINRIVIQRCWVVPGGELVVHVEEMP